MKMTVLEKAILLFTVLHSFRLLHCVLRLTYKKGRKNKYQWLKGFLSFIQILFCFLTGEVIGMALNTYMQDLLLKTSFNGQQLMLLGPFSLKADGTYSLVTFDTHCFLSQTVVTLATGLVTLHIGQEHVLCLMMIAEHVTELLKVWCQLECIEENLKLLS